MNPLTASTLAALIALPSVAPSPEVHRGIAKYYAPGVFARVARIRHMPLRRDVDGYAATTNCNLIGSVIPARINGHRLERFQVLDCSAPRDRQRHLREHLVIEVDYATAVRDGIVTNGRGTATAWYPTH